MYNKLWKFGLMTKLEFEYRSFPKEQEKIERTGLWKDPSTNKTWMRCSLGQIWTGNDCENNSKQHYTWEEAKSAINELNEQEYGGYKNWRLPYLVELETLQNNEITQLIYPSNYISRFWSIDSKNSSYAFTSVYSGGRFFSDASYKGDHDNYVRAVRNH